MWPVGVNPLLLHVGPIARTVADAALVLRIIAGPDRRDPFSLLEPIGREPDAEAVRTLRVAFSPTMGVAESDAPVGRVINAAIDRLKSVFPSLATVTDNFPDFSEVHRAMFFAGLSARFGDLVDTSPELIDPALVAAIKRFREMSVDTYTRLLRRQFEVRETLRQFFEQYDLLLTPTLPSVAWDIEKSLRNMRASLKPGGHYDHDRLARDQRQSVARLCEGGRASIPAAAWRECVELRTRAVLHGRPRRGDEAARNRGLNAG